MSDMPKKLVSETRHVSAAQICTLYKLMNHADYVVASKYTSESNEPVQDEALELTGIYILCMQFQEYKKWWEMMVTKELTLYAPHTLTVFRPNWKEVLLLIRLKIKICHSLHDFDNRHSSTASMSWYQPQLRNGLKRKHIRRSWTSRNDLYRSEGTLL